MLYVCVLCLCVVCPVHVFAVCACVGGCVCGVFVLACVLYVGMYVCCVLMCVLSVELSVKFWVLHMLTNGLHLSYNLNP